MNLRALILLAALMPLGLAAQTIALERVHVVTLDGEQVHENHAVTIEDGRIVAIIPMAEYEPVDDAIRIDGEGGWLMPGLVDSHVHIEEYMGARADFGDAPLFLRHGITAVFNLRGFPKQLPLRDRIAAGEILAPTFYTAGEFVNEPRVNTPDEAAAEVRAQARAGYDMIKFREVVDHEVGVLTTHGVDLATFRAVHAVARELGMPVLGHAPHGLGLDPVIETGHTLAHIGELVGLHFFPRHVPFQWRAYLFLLAGLAVLALVAAVWRLLASPASKASAGTVLARSLLALLLGMSGYALPLLLLPGGWQYGNPLLIGLLVLCLAALLLLGLQNLLGAVRARPARTVMARVALALTGAAALGIGSLGLIQDVPAALRATPGEMDRIAARLAGSGAHVGTTLVLYDELSTLRRTGSRSRIEPGAPETVDAADGLREEFRRHYLRSREFFARVDWRSRLSFDGLLVRYDDFTRELAGALHRAGVPLMAGTDAFGVGLIPPGRSLHAELEILVEAGLSPYQALRTATVEPARFLGREHEFGRIAPGLRADLVLLAANPLADVRALGEPRGVVLRGRWLSREALDAHLAGLEGG
jgi:imidazolonepropionase-like amidohydrolase